MTTMQFARYGDALKALQLASPSEPTLSNIQITATGYDQASEIEQYFNDTGGINRAQGTDFGRGTYVLGRPIVIRHSRKDPKWTSAYGSGGLSYGLRMLGVSPGETVLQYVGKTDLTDSDGNLRPAILVTTPNSQPAPYNANRDVMSLIEGFQLVCSPDGVRNPIGTVTGSAIEFRPESGAIRVASSPAQVGHELRRLVIDGFAYGVSGYDVTNILLSRVWFQDFLQAVRLGYNCDIWEFDQCMFGMENYGTGAGTNGAGHRLNTLSIATGWQPSGTYVAPGNANNLLFRECWVYNHDQFIVLGANEQNIKLDNVYFEKMAQYFSSGVSTGKLVLDLNNCHFSNPSDINLAWNDARVIPMFIGNGFGAKIDVGSGSGIISLRHCTSDAVLAPPGGYLRVKNGGDVYRIVLESNDLSAGAHGHMLADDGASGSQTRTLPNRANGSYTFGGWLGMSKLSGQDITPDGKATGSYPNIGAGNVTLDHNVADSYSYTLPTAGTVTFTTAGGYPPDGLRIKLRIRSPASGSCNVAFSGYFSPDAITQHGASLNSYSYFEFECLNSRMIQVSPPNKWVA